MQNSDIASLVLAAVGSLLLAVGSLPKYRACGRKSPFLSVRALRSPWDLWTYDKQNEAGSPVAKWQNHRPRAILRILSEAFLAILKFWPFLLVFSILSQRLLPDYPQQEVVRKLKTGEGPDFVDVIWVACLLSPIVEELVFRGLLYPMLKGRMGVFWGCVSSSLIFALIHENVLSFALLFSLSVYLTFLYERENNLLMPIASHAFFNLFMLTLMFVDGP